MHNKDISGFRLSPQQKRLWLLQQDSFSSHAMCCLLLEGNLKPEVLKAALQQLVVKHEILRTTFRHISGIKIPVMVVSNTNLLWCELNLSDEEAKEQKAKIQELIQAEKCQDFDLQQGPLLHTCLIRLSAQKHVLLVSLPAICADTQTLKNLVRAISHAYAACIQGEELDDEVVQYVQVSEWQNQLLEDPEAEVGKEYWRQQDLSSLATLTLPFESKSAKKSEFDECSPSVINLEVVQKIEALVKKYDSSADVFFLACWQTLLMRLLGQPDIIVGIGCARREYEELHNVLGLIATWLPIHCHLAPDLRFGEVLELVGQATQDAKEWQDYFVWEHANGSNGKVSAFPIGFEFEELPEKWLAAGISFSLYKQYTCIEPFKVKLTCTRDNDSLSYSFHYNVNGFAAETIQRLAGQFETLLASALAHPDTAISQLDILSQVERQQLLVEFNNTHQDYPKDRCIHQLFEEQVERTPNNAAVVFEDQQLTYAQLNAQANQLAHHLQKIGVGPEVLVGLYVERSLSMIVGLLGILKAGGAYLPLDPALPTESLTLRLQDAQAQVLLTQQSLVNTLPTQTARVISLDKNRDKIAQNSEGNPNSEVKSDNLVYVIFTSGSTGRPKGVAIEHQQLLNYYYAIKDRLNLSVRANFATLSTLAADLGNTTVFTSLCTGGCLHLISSSRAVDPVGLAEYCQRHPIDCLKIVPSHLRVLLASSLPKSILPRQQLILGGEAATWDLIEQIKNMAPECHILNHYGPTEATVGVLTYAVKDKQAGYDSQTVPLGRPLANTQVYVLDEQRRPVPIGIKGELYIGGAGLARGYLNQSNITASRFIANPLIKTHSIASNCGSHLYKTGDLVRCLPDGNIEFIGRVDRQVKMRGFRIELEEIEAVLSQHPGVQQAVVSVQGEDLNNKRLAAYLVPNREQTPSVSNLCSFLKEKLPQYMVPSAFVMLNALPLTSNGKVDLSALPTPNRANCEQQAAFVAPRDTLEVQLVHIWEDILQVSPIGVTDNFFDLGGHSLLAIGLIAQIQHKFRQNLPLATLFQSTTIEQLAGTLRQQISSTSWSPLVEIQRGGSNRPFFCVHPVGGNVFCYVDLAYHLDPNQPFYGLQAAGLNGEQEPCPQIKAMAERYIKAIRAIQPSGPYLLGGWSMGGIVAFEMAQQLQAQGQKVALLALIDATAKVSDTEYTDEDDVTLLGSFAQDLLGLSLEHHDFSVDHFLQLSPEQRLTYILEQGQITNLPISHLFHVFKTNCRAVANYVPLAYPGRVTLFRANNHAESHLDPTMGWGKLAAEGVEIHVVPGNHYTLIGKPYVQVLAEQLRNCLDKAQAFFAN